MIIFKILETPQKGIKFWITLVKKFDLFIRKNEVRGNYRENSYYLNDATLYGFIFLKRKPFSRI